MALLQISEPGQSAAPHERKVALGIDLGTTNSLVATVRSGTAEPLADGDGHVILPYPLNVPFFVTSGLRLVRTSVTRRPLLGENFSAPHGGGTVTGKDRLVRCVGRAGLAF